MASAIARLAAYEDTGLEPEMVCDLLERFNSLYAIFDDLDLIDRAHFQAFLDRVRRWHQAEKDGRLKVIPCKAGETLWSLYNYPASGICRILVAEISIFKNITVISADNYGMIPEKEIGKTVFLTREEAEVALKKMEGADNEAD